jgi:hypothetical protein
MFSVSTKKAVSTDLQIVKAGRAGLHEALSSSGAASTRGQAHGGINFIIKR